MEIKQLDIKFISLKKQLVNVPILFFLLTLSFFQFAYADSNRGGPVMGLGWAYANNGEFSAFQEYCQARFYSKDAPLYKKWKKRIGGDFIHIHHY